MLALEPAVGQSFEQFFFQVQFDAFELCYFGEEVDTVPLFFTELQGEVVG